MKGWFCVFTIALATLTTAQAHRLTVEWELAGGTLEIRAVVGRESAAGADVALRDASGAILAEGVLDETGRFRWPLRGPGPITIDVNAGLGHRRSLILTQSELEPGLDRAEGAATAAGPIDGSAPRVSGSSEAAFSQVVRVGLGLTFLLALAATWMSHRNTRRLTDLERRLERYEGRG